MRYMRSTGRRSRAIALFTGAVLLVSACGQRATEDADVTSTTGAATNDPEAVSCTMQETGPIVIGNVSNASGLAASTVGPSIEVLSVWADHINESGGLCGRQVELVLADDRGDPAQHQAAVADLVENRNVVAFVGNAAPLTGESSVSYLENANVPVIGNSCTTDSDEYEFNYPHFAQCSSGDAALLGAAYNAVEEADAERIAILYCAEAQQCSDLNDSFTELAPSAGAEIVYSASVGLLQPDFTTECRQAKEAGADALLVGMDVGGTQRVVGSCSRQGFQPTLLAITATVNPELAQDPSIDRILWSGQWFGFADDSTPEKAEFQDFISSRLGREPSPGDAAQWTAAKMFERAVTMVADAGEPLSSASLIAALRDFEDETLGGLSTPLNFEEGEPQGSDCWFAASAQDGQWSTLNDGEYRCP